LLRINTFSLLLANFETVTGFVCVAHVQYALSWLIAGLGASILARLLSAIVSSALGSHKAGNALVKKLQATGENFDLDVFVTEFERGYFPLQRRMIQCSIKKVRAGDVVAGARLIAMLSQLQALLVLIVTVLTILASATLVAGLKGV
jgi:hypothetical protein